MTRVVNMNGSDYDVNIGRNINGVVPKIPGYPGWLGNPFKIGDVYDWDSGESEVIDRRLSIDLYGVYFRTRVKHDGRFRRKVKRLKGKTLGCYCKPRDCHGDIIVRWLEENA